MQILSHTLRVVQKLEARVQIEVLAVGGLDGAAVCSLAGLLDLQSEQDFNESRKAASEKWVSFCALSLVYYLKNTCQVLKC